MYFRTRKLIAAVLAALLIAGLPLEDCPAGPKDPGFSYVDMGALYNEEAARARFVMLGVSTDKCRVFSIEIKNDAGSYFEILGGIEIDYTSELAVKS